MRAHPQSAEFDIKKEAAWAISNATSGGTAEQLKYLVDVGAIKPLCDLLTVQDVRIVTVALEGLENILKVQSAMTRHNIQSKSTAAVCLFTRGCRPDDYMGNLLLMQASQILIQFHHLHLSNVCSVGW